MRSRPLRSPRAPASRAFYVVVRGPLGIGKTTVARRLAEALGGLYLSVDEVLERPRFERWRQGRITQASFLRCNVVIARAAGRALRAGRPVVVDGNFYYRSQIDDLERRISRPHLIARLEAPLRVCIARDRSRPFSFGAENVRAVYRMARSVRAGVAIDARGSLASVVAAIRSRLPPLGSNRDGGRPPSAVGRGRPRRSTESRAARTARARRLLPGSSPRR